jgi:hypothetical protein
MRDLRTGSRGVYVTTQAWPLSAWESPIRPEAVLERKEATPGPLGTVHAHFSSSRRYDTIRLAIKGFSQPLGILNPTESTLQRLGVTRKGWAGVRQKWGFRFASTGEEREVFPVSTGKGASSFLCFFLRC